MNREEKFRRRRTIAVVAAIITMVSGLAGWNVVRRSEKPPIRVGILHSQSGTMAASEGPVIQATLLAIDEINGRGGVLGRRIEPVLYDGRSDGRTFAEGARHLIVDENVSVIFGCWTSASRKMVKPVVEQFKHLLFYPVQYEGLETSPHIVYTGAAPNQQIIPAVKWSFETLGRRVYLVGSDYVFPRIANSIIRDHVRALRGEVVGERYLLLGSTDVDEIVKDIAATRPDVILNTINGDSNVAFFRALREAGVTPEVVPTVSFSIGETELQKMEGVPTRGDYAAWNYFQSIESEGNDDFVARFRAKHGAEATTNDPMEAAYFGVHLWAQAVNDAASEEVSAVRDAVGRQSWHAPGGVVYVDPETQHTWKTVRIGRIGEGGAIKVVWSSERPVRPVPYPIFRTPDAWRAQLDALQAEWGGSWANPGVVKAGVIR